MDKLQLVDFYWELSWERMMCAAMPQVSDNPSFPKEVKTVITLCGDKCGSG